MAPRKKQPQVILSPQSSSTGDSLIDPELTRFNSQVNELLNTLESVNLLSIEDVEDRLKAGNLKLTMSLKMPILLNALDDLRNRAKLKTENIKGNKDISLLESGELT